MQAYRNRDGSNIVAFDIGEASITIEFASGACYRYTDESAGSRNIVKMQELAKSGSGLASFIVERNIQESSKEETEQIPPMRAQEALRELRGKLEWEGDLDAMRLDK